MIGQWLKRAWPHPAAISRANSVGGLTGVYEVPDPAGALRAMGIEPAWHNCRVAFAGAPVWHSDEQDVTVCGDAVLDNADELRCQLEMPNANGYALLGALYAREGLSGVRCALGMFAVAVWDGCRQRLTLLRDSVGARTLYYARDGQAWWFAARLRELRRCPAVSGDVSLSALRNYLTFAFVPDAETMWQGASEVRPGTAVIAPTGDIESYWEPRAGTWDPAETIGCHARRLRPLLENAVQVRLPPTGPVGVFLSGGIDSSLVTALAARAAPGRVYTYAIHFGEQYPNELAYSSLAARRCRTQHRILEIPASQVQAELPETMRALDDPIGDPLTVPNLLLGRLAAQDTNTVLNGEGGDPCFGGPKNLPMMLNELYAHEANRAQAYLRAYQKCYDDLSQLLTADTLAALHTAGPQEAILADFLDNPAMAHYLNKLTLVNVRLKGADHILTKVNNLTTANGLLGRSPLFDRRIVETSFAIPPEYKLAGAIEKAVLKQAVADLLPALILMRPKSGMLVPVQA